MARIIPVWMIGLAVLSLAAMVPMLWGSDHRLAPAYYGMMLALGVWADRKGWAAHWLQGLPGPVVLRVLALGYGAVLAEETLVGTLYALAEGITPALWAARVGQFVAFNLLAFSGVIWGLGIAYMAWPGLRRWHLVLAGGWGLFAEGTLAMYAQNPIAALALTPTNICIYTIILAPLMVSLPKREGAFRWWQVPATWALCLALSIAPVAGLMQLRAAYPAAFPSCAYIRC